MATRLTQQPIPNVIGGVSEQPESLRLPGQLHEDVNSYGDPVLQWNKRPPMEHVSTLSNAITGDQLVHWIDRDSSEQYVVQAGDQTLKVYDLAGVEQTINRPDGVAISASDLTYLDCTTPSEELTALTIADYTFLTNRTKTASLKAAVTPSRNKEAIVSVRQGNYATRYKIEFEWEEPGGAGTQKRIVTYTSYFSDGTRPAGGGTKNINTAEASIRTRQIARQLALGLTNGAFDADLVTIDPTDNDVIPANFTIIQQGSGIHIELVTTTASLTDFKIQTDDDVASTLLQAFKDEADDFGRLPLWCKNQFTIKIVADLQQPKIGTYWVKFVVTDGSGFGDGYWKETVAPGIPYQLNELLMPHLLRRNSDGTWTYGPADGATDVSGSPDMPSWTERDVGDDVTNKRPGFIGKKIHNLCFYKDRMGVLAGQTLMLSTVGDAFSFWRTTVVDLLDSDRIRRESPYSSIADFKHAVPREGHLLILSDRAQFVLQSAGEALTPSDAEMSVVGEYDLDGLAPPLPLRNSVMVSGTRGDRGMIREFVDISQQRPRYEAPDITAHVPSFLGGFVRAAAAVEPQGVVILRTTPDLSRLKIYQFFQVGQERVQSAWRLWTASGAVHGVGSYESKFYFVVERGSEVSLEVMDVQPSLVDPGSNFRFALDRRIDHSSITVSYDANTKQSTLTLPYSHLDARTLGVYEPSGVRRKLVSVSGTSAVVDGDLTGVPLWVGELYPCYGTMKHPYRMSGSESRLLADTSRRTKVAKAALHVEDSGYLDIYVQPPEGFKFDGGVGAIAGPPGGGGGGSGGGGNWNIMQENPWFYTWAGFNDENITIVPDPSKSPDDVIRAKDLTGRTNRDWVELTGQTPGTLYGYNDPITGWSTTISQLATDGANSNDQYGNVYTQATSFGGQGDFYLGLVLANNRGGGERDLWGNTQSNFMRYHQDPTHSQPLAIVASGKYYKLVDRGNLPQGVGYLEVIRTNGNVKVYWNKAEISIAGGVTVPEAFDWSGFGWRAASAPDSSSSYYDDEMFAAVAIKKSPDPTALANIRELEINRIWALWTPPPPPGGPADYFGPPVQTTQPRWVTQFRGGTFGENSTIEKVNLVDQEIRFSVKAPSRRAVICFSNESPFPSRVTGGNLWFAMPGK